MAASPGELSEMLGRALEEKELEDEKKEEAVADSSPETGFSSLLCCNGACNSVISRLISRIWTSQQTVAHWAFEDFEAFLRCVLEGHSEEVDALVALWNETAAEVLKRESSFEEDCIDFDDDSVVRSIPRKPKAEEIKLKYADCGVDSVMAALALQLSAHWTNEVFVSQMKPLLFGWYLVNGRADHSGEMAFIKIGRLQEEICGEYMSCSCDTRKLLGSVLTKRSEEIFEDEIVHLSDASFHVRNCADCSWIIAVFLKVAKMPEVLFAIAEDKCLKKARSGDTVYRELRQNVVDFQRRDRVWAVEGTNPEFDEFKQQLKERNEAMRALKRRADLALQKMSRMTVFQPRVASSGDERVDEMRDSIRKGAIAKINRVFGRWQREEQKLSKLIDDVESAMHEAVEKKKVDSDKHSVATDADRELAPLVEAKYREMTSERLDEMLSPAFAVAKARELLDCEAGDSQQSKTRAAVNRILKEKNSALSEEEIMALYYFTKMGIAATEMMKSLLYRKDHCTYAKWAQNCVSAVVKIHRCLPTIFERLGARVRQPRALWRGMNEFKGDTVTFHSVASFSDRLTTALDFARRSPAIVLRIAPYKWTEEFVIAPIWFYSPVPEGEWLLVPCEPLPITEAHIGAAADIPRLPPAVFRKASFTPTDVRCFRFDFLTQSLESTVEPLSAMLERIKPQLPDWMQEEWEAITSFFGSIFALFFKARCMHCKLVTRAVMNAGHPMSVNGAYCIRCLLPFSGRFVDKSQPMICEGCGEESELREYAQVDDESGAECPKCGAHQYDAKLHSWFPELAKGGDTRVQRSWKLQELIVKQYLAKFGLRIEFSAAQIKKVHKDLIVRNLSFAQVLQSNVTLILSVAVGSLFASIEGAPAKYVALIRPQITGLLVNSVRILRREYNSVRERDFLLNDVCSKLAILPGFLRLYATS